MVYQFLVKRKGNSGSAMCGDHHIDPARHKFLAGRIDQVRKGKSYPSKQAG